MQIIVVALKNNGVQGGGRGGLSPPPLPPLVYATAPGSNYLAITQSGILVE